MRVKINCADCSFSYIDKTKRSFNTRRKEHRRNVELCTSGYNITNHASTNNPKYILIAGKSLTKATIGTDHTAHGTLL
jgi:hypothetical protein